MGTKGIMHTGTGEVAAAGSFDKLPDGFYPVNKIEKFITKDPAGEPVFATKYGDKLKVSFEFGVVGQPVGLACSLTPAEYYAMAMQCYGINLKDAGVTAKNRLSSKAIQSVADRINASGKQTMIQARDGWVNFVKDGIPPENLYTVALSDIRRPDRKEGLEFQESEFGSSLLFEFVIAGDATGRPTIFDGFPLVVYMNDPFVDSFIKHDDKGKEYLITAEEAGCPLWQNKDNHPTSLAMKWAAFVKYFAPEINEHEWETDPVASRFGINELAYPQYVIAGYALNTKRKAVLHYKDRPKGRRNIDLKDLDSLNESALDTLEEAEPEEDVKDTLRNLVSYITSTAGEGIFENTDPNSGPLVFTEAGKLWAGNVMMPVWVRAGLGEKRALHLLNGAEVRALLAEFNKPEAVTEEKEIW